MALSCCRKYKTIFKFITMKTDTKQTENLDECGNKSKPLLAVVKVAKCKHNWKTNVVEQYQQCTKCGKGHAL